MEILGKFAEQAGADLGKPFDIAALQVRRRIRARGQRRATGAPNCTQLELQFHAIYGRVAWYGVRRFFFPPTCELMRTLAALYFETFRDNSMDCP